MNLSSYPLEKRNEELVCILEYFDEREERYSITSLDLAKHLGLEHDYTVGLINSLSSRQKLKLSPPQKRLSWQLTEEGNRYAEVGSPEAYIVKVLNQSSEGRLLTDVLCETTKFDRNTLELGLKVVLKEKWAKMDSGTKRLTLSSEAPSQDRTQFWLLLVKEAQKENDSEGTLLKNISERTKIPVANVTSRVINEFKRRKLITSKTLKYYYIERGTCFSTQLLELAADLTKEMILKGTWRNVVFKTYNFYAPGYRVSRGSIHPLQRTAQRFRRVFLNMGFEEMPTDNWVESSFWNFDALFQPQQHPSRDMHDTFFLRNPSHSNIKDVPPEYIEAVKNVHEHGGYGSTGWHYEWSLDEARKNVMRTHTTACSTRMLFNLAQQYKRTGQMEPKKYFSIDRVFRNETLDATHLAEFHQVEGLICDRELSLANLLGVLKTFYSLIGISKLRFKPAYNPYTEPSVEVFGYHSTLNKWIEVGNSGIFRPEMLCPMGFPENIRVIAWGLSLERPTMIQYHMKNIRDLFGHQAILGIA